MILFLEFYICYMAWNVSQNAISSDVCVEKILHQEKVLSEWQFNRDHILHLSLNPKVLLPTGGSVKEGDERLRVEALSSGIWLSEEEPFLNINDTGSLERLTMAMRLAGMSLMSLQ